MFCELIDRKLEMFREASELFPLGLRSAIEAFLNVPMADVLAEIPVEDAIKTRFAGATGPVPADF